MGEIYYTITYCEINTYVIACFSMKLLFPERLWLGHMKKSENLSGPSDDAPMTRKQWQDQLQIGKTAINLDYKIRVGNRRMASAQAARLACGIDCRIQASQLVNGLLERDDWIEQMLGEVSVHRPRGGKIYVAAFTGPEGGQVTKTTGTKDYPTAMVIGQEYEAAARAQRTQFRREGPNQRIRNRRSPGRTAGGLTQREVAVMLKITERAVRAIERRALRKLAQHPQLREIWHNYLTGELSEQACRLSASEIRALLGLARSGAERETLLKVLAIIHK